MMPSAKIELRVARPEDVPSLRRIWRESFGDEDRYINFFLANRFVPENTPVLTVGGDMASQLFLLPAALRAGDKQVPIDYLFAAATAPVYRRRGYMKLLLRYAAELSEQRGKAAIVLRPGSEELYRYYAKFGYQIAFSERVWTCTRDALQAFSEPCGAADAIPVLTAFFQQTDGVVWEKDALRYALSEYRTFRGKAAAGGQAFAAESEDGAQIIAPVSALGQGFSLLLSLSDAPAFTVTLPPDATFGTRQNSGMIRFLTDPIPIQNAFLSFAME